jgi:hypothetical protein
MAHHLGPKPFPGAYLVSSSPTYALYDVLVDELALFQNKKASGFFQTNLAVKPLPFASS